MYLVLKYLDVKSILGDWPTLRCRFDLAGHKGRPCAYLGQGADADLKRSNIGHNPSQQTKSPSNSVVMSELPSEVL
jgi:hypothetical protein